MQPSKLQQKRNLTCKKCVSLKAVFHISALSNLCLLIILSRPSDDVIVKVITDLDNIVGVTADMSGNIHVGWATALPVTITCWWMFFSNVLQTRIRCLTFKCVSFSSDQCRVLEEFHEKYRNFESDSVGFTFSFQRCAGSPIVSIEECEVIL